MAGTSERQLFEALATLSRACAEGSAPGETEALAAMDPEAREVLGEAALAVAFGAFAARGAAAGAMQVLLAGMGLLAMQAGEPADPPAEILAIAAGDAQVEAEIDRAGDAVDAAFGRDAPPEAVVAALEARLLGTAITLAGITMPEGMEGQEAVRLNAARSLLRLAAGLVAMNAAAPGAPGATLAAPDPCGPAGTRHP